MLDTSMKNGLTSNELVSLLQELIKSESPDPPGNERIIAGMLSDKLRSLGFEVDCEEFAPNRFNVITKIPGNGSKPGMVFSAHMDTLPVGNGDWKHPPFEGVVDDGKIYGRGAVDMKSGLAAMVSAGLAVLRDTQEGFVPEGDLVLAFSGGESSSCIGSKRMVERGILKDCGPLLISEPSTMDVFCAEKGALWIRATAHGISGHLSGEGGDETASLSAITAMMSFLGKLESTLPTDSHELLGKATANVGRIEGGTAINLTPDRCSAEIDFRLLPHHDPLSIEADLKALAGVDFSFERLDYKPAVETPTDHPFVTLCCEETSKIRGQDIKAQGVSYFSDACVLVPGVGLDMVIVGPGIMGGSGSLNEACRIDYLEDAAELYYRIAKRYLSKD